MKTPFLERKRMWKKSCACAIQQVTQKIAPFVQPTNIDFIFERVRDVPFHYRLLIFTSFSKGETGVHSDGM